MGTTWLCIHINSNGSLFLWNPSSMESCQNTKLIKNDSAAKLAINNENQVGDWYKINGDTAVKAERPGICETRIRKNRLEVGIYIYLSCKGFEANSKYYPLGLKPKP